MSGTLKNEFKWLNFTLQHKNRRAFTSSQWDLPRGAFVIIRLVLAIYTTVFIITNIVKSFIEGYFALMAWLTIWTYIVMTIYFILSAVTAIISLYSNKACPGHNTANTNDNTEMGNTNMAYIDIDEDSHVPRNTGNDVTKNGPINTSDDSTDDQITPLMKVTWVLGNIVQVCAIIVTLVYFTALYPAVGRTSFVDQNYHSMNTLFMLLDTCISARPVRLLHIVHPILYGLIYIIFNLIFWSFDHVNNVLYPGVIDWNNLGMTIVWVGCITLIGMPLLHLAYFGAFQLRLYIYKRIYGVEYQ